MRLRRLTYPQRLERYQPILVRLLARLGHGKLAVCPSDEHLSEVSGLALARVKLIGYSYTWAGIPIEEHFAFMRGCEIDLENRRTFKRLEAMRTAGTFGHLRRSDLWEKQFREMVELYGDNCQ